MTEASYARVLRSIVCLLLALAWVVQMGRTLQVESASGELPFLSANDRSRWCTVAALATQGSYEIDHLIFEGPQQQRRSPWSTIDLVRHRGSDGKLHYYSSKPPLLPTIYAGVYWLLRTATGWTLMQHPFPVARILLVAVNLIPLGIFWWIFMHWFRQQTDNFWANAVMASMIAWGTFLSTFVITLNNHLPAALAVAVSVWCLDRILLRNDTRARWFAICGLGTSFGAANELPALSWVAAAGAILLVAFPRKTILAYIPALLPVTLAFFGTNYLAHGELAPAYAHRDAGRKLFEFDVARQGQLQVSEVISAMEENGIYPSADSSLRPARRPNTFEFLDQTNQQQYAIRVPTDSSRTVALHEWADWYDYPGSYWAGEKQGVDKGEASRGKYLFHCLLGHHGILSLTPFWWLSMVGCIQIWRQRTTRNIFRDRQLLIAAAMLATTVVVLGFYFSRGLEDRNYGGVTSGLRWTFWLIPLWLWLATECFRRTPRVAVQRLIEALVLLSVFSATFPWGNPWTSPWIMQLMEFMNWPI